MIKRRTLAIALAMLLTFTLTGCFNDTPEEQPTETATPSPTPTEEVVTPKEGGTLNLSMRVPKTLNPLLNEDKTVDTILKLLFEPLVVLDDELNPTPNVAESFTLASDGSSMVIKLREDVFWSDGIKLSAEDLVYTLDVLKSAPDTSLYKESVRNVLQHTKVDENTVKLTYAQPFGGSSFLLMFPVIPKHHYSQPAAETDMLPLGNGFYTFEAYEQMEKLTLKKNTNCFRGKPYINGISVHITPDYETDIHTFEQGITDLLVADMSVWSKYSGTKNTQSYEFPTTLYELIGFNHEKPLTGNIQVKRAIAQAIDVSDIIANVYLTHSEKTPTPIHKSSSLYNSEVDVGLNQFDLEKAKQQLTYSAVKIEPDETLEIIVNEENESRQKTAEIVSQALTKLELNNKVVSLPFEEYLKRLNERDYDIFVGGFNMSLVPDFTFMLHSSQAENGTNYFSYADTIMDNFLQSAFNANSDFLFKTALKNVQKQIVTELPFIGIAYKKTSLITDARVYGDKKPKINNPFYNINEWFLND